MNANDVHRGLQSLADRLRPLLESDAANVLQAAQAQVHATKREYDRRIQQHRVELPVLSWGYEITPEHPLRFKVVKLDGLRLRTDLFAKCYWRREDDEPVALGVVVRIWCLDASVVFREDIDAAGIAPQIDKEIGRVMLRIHFDRAEPDQEGPKYHLQYGGNARPDEIAWFPETISLPRIAHPPFDLVLAAETAAANFFPDEYRRIKRDPTWVGALRDSQAGLLQPYMARCIEALQSREASLLNILWNEP